MFFLAHAGEALGAGEGDIGTLFLLANSVFVFAVVLMIGGMLMGSRLVEWMLRFGIVGIFLPHGLSALQGNAAFVEWLHRLLGVSEGVAVQLLLVIGVVDIALAMFALLWPVRLALLWAALWGFSTALIVPLLGGTWLEFAGETPQWAMPLALLFLRGWPRKRSELFR